MKERKETPLGFLPWTVGEVVNVAVAASQMAERVGGEFVLQQEKLRSLGLKPADIRQLRERLPANIKVDRHRAKPSNTSHT